MKRKGASLSIVAILLVVIFLPGLSVASLPPLPAEPTSLPVINYMYDGEVHNVTSSLWNSFITNVYNNNSYVRYNWSGNATEDLILFDLSYKALNPYGLQVITELGTIGAPSIGNLTLAFNGTRSMTSCVPGYSNIEALNSGAYPGFSWSVPHVKKPLTQEIYTGIIIGLAVSILVLYFVFNRRR